MYPLKETIAVKANKRSLLTGNVVGEGTLVELFIIFLKETLLALTVKVKATRIEMISKGFKNFMTLLFKVL